MEVGGRVCVICGGDKFYFGDGVGDQDHPICSICGWVWYPLIPDAKVGVQEWVW